VKDADYLFRANETCWRGQQPPQIRFGKEVEDILAALSKTGALYPHLQTVRATDRATEFKQRCVGLSIHAVSLHGYRYAWAERAKIVGYPARFAQLALGHNSKAVHRPFAKYKNHFATLDDYEREREEKVVPTTQLASAHQL
jgi:hypothetical protein